MDYSKMPTSALLFDELPGLCRCGVDCTDSIQRAEILAELDRRIPIQTAPKLDGWQPIDTAPKGPYVLVWCSGWAAPVIGWCQGSEWRDENELLRPSHWMPLPEVPR